MSKNQFPKELFVQEIVDDDQSYFAANKTINDLDEYIKTVAVYVLKELKTFKVKREFV